MLIIIFLSLILGCLNFKIKLNMKHYLTLCMAILSSWSFSQSNLTIFNNDGRQFYAIMNGIKQNAVPQTNVYISNVKNGVYSVKLIFADGITADIDKNVYFDEPSDVVTRVKFKKGKGTLQLISILPTTGPLQEPSTVIYRSSDASAYSDATQQTVVSTPVQQQVAPPAQTTTVTTTTSTSQVTSSNNSVPVTNQTNGNAGMNMSVNVTDPTMTNGQAGMNMSVNVTDPTMTNGQAGMNMSVNVTDPTMTNGQAGMNMSVNVSDPTMTNGQAGLNMQMNVTDPTLTGTGGVNMNVNVTDPLLTGNGGLNMNVGSTSNQSSTSYQTSNTTITTTTTTTSNQVTSPPPVQQIQQTQQVPVQTNQTPLGCRNILGDGDQFVADLKDLNFDADRKDAIIGDLASFCLTASQAYKIIETLNYDSDRLEASKFLFERMIDKDKGNVLLPLLTFDSSKMEYREHMRKFR